MAISHVFLGVIKVFFLKSLTAFPECLNPLACKMASEIFLFLARDIRSMLLLVIYLSLFVVVSTSMMFLVVE